LRSSAPIFAALGDATRLRLVAVLCAGGAMSIAQLTSGTDITRQAVTKHLHVLADAGLVRDVKVGRERCGALSRRVWMRRAVRSSGSRSSGIVHWRSSRRPWSVDRYVTRRCGALRFPHPTIAMMA